MRILHTECSRGWGGQEIRILAEACGMVARGHDVWLAAPLDSPIAKSAAARGLRLVPVRFRRPWGVRDVPILRRTIRRLAVEVVNTHSSWDAWIAGMAARLAGATVGLVRTRHVSTPIAHSPASRFLYTRLADRVVTTGEVIRQAMIRRNGFPAARIVSVATGLDLAAFRPRRDPLAVRASLGIPADAPVVGTVSTLRSWKGHRYLLEAIASLRSERDVRGLLVGDGPYAATIRSRIRELGLEAAVTMTGQREDVADLLMAMDVFAFPSTANEGVPQAVLQAMALRRPVVATRVGGIPEAVRDGETGLAVPAGDAAALARGLGRVLADPPVAAAWTLAAENLVRSEYTLEVMLDKMEQVYRAALDPAGRAPGVAAPATDGRGRPSSAA
jgi:glycosyltransferase involved in cell wall biosynthesis